MIVIVIVMVFGLLTILDGNNVGLVKLQRRFDRLWAGHCGYGSLDLWNGW